MRRIRMALALAAASLLSCSILPIGPGEADRATYAVYRLASAPVIDGQVHSDPAWGVIPGVSGFRVLGGDYAIAKQTTARAGWTNDALFVAVDCEEPDIALINDKLKDGEELWKDNGVEIFLEIPGKPGVFQLVVNTIGSHAMGEGAVDISKWQAAAVKGKDFWSLEARIPFACLQATPAAGATWGGAFCRNIWEYKSGGDKFTTWPALKNRFREPESFAVLAFDERSLSPKEAEQMALKRNAPYREYLTRQVADLARCAVGYEGPIAEAHRKKDFQAEAQELKSDWARIRTLASESAQAPLPEMRRFVAKANDLKRRSYELKYRFLIDALLME